MEQIKECLGKGDKILLQYVVVSKEAVDKRVPRHKLKEAVNKRVPP
jgi:hypothetical protein